MKRLMRRRLGEAVWQRLGQTKQELKWRKIKNFAAPELRPHLETLLNFRNGFYVEIGSNDGRSFSNTFHLEFQQNWRGILIEPILQKHFESKIHRQGSKNIFIYGACVEENYTEESVKLFYSNLMTSSGDGEAQLWAEKGQDFLSNGELVQPFWAPSVKLSRIFKNHDIHSIDFLSLDVEGAELNVLNGINWDEVKIELILIETPSNSVSIELLKQKGYKHIVDLGFNHFFRKSHDPDESNHEV